MEKVKIISGKVMPLTLSNVDTDMIIPAQFMTSTSKTGYGENLFRRLRDADPNFVFNKDCYKNAKILIASENFGSGSSREHAVWAITGAGFRAVIAKSFADIFFNNSAKNGLLLVVLSAEVVDNLLKDAQSGQYCLEINLETQTVTLADRKTVHFDYEAFSKHCLLNGLDDIDYIRSHADKINAYRSENEKYRFFDTTCVSS